MKIINLTKHNIKSLNAEIPVAHSIGIAGLSGSGKTTFCEVISDEYKRRMISLLPKADRDFLFKDLAKTDYGSLQLEDIPPTKFFHQDGVFFSPRSTIGTHSGVFKSLRRVFANRFNLSIQYFSYNNPTESNADLICRKCMGRGTFGGNTCVQCNGNRYTQKINDYSIVIGESKYSLLSLFQMPVSKLLLLADQLNLPPKDKLLLTAFTRLELGYLSLDRTFGTLSGGEITRIQLAEAITCSHNNLIIIDELSHGLDSQSLDNVLQVVSDLGKDNVLWFIDHSDQVLDLTNDKSMNHYHHHRQRVWVTIATSKAAFTEVMQPADTSEGISTTIREAGAASEISRPAMSVRVTAESSAREAVMLKTSSAARNRETSFLDIGCPSSGKKIR